MSLGGHSEHCRCSHCEPHGVPGAAPLIVLNGVSFLREGRPVLADVNFTVDYGDFIAITGPNGGGKTTLLRLILGLLRPHSGCICFYDRAGKACASPSFGYLPQKNSVDALFPITVHEVVESGLLCEKALSKSDRSERVAQALETVVLADLAERPIGRLSGGQLQRAMLARAIVRQPDVLVLDEPLSYIDLKFEDRLYYILQEQARHSTVLMVSHQMSRLGSLANRHILVDHALDECTARIHFHPEQ